jgi:hypothetical protein
MAGLPDSFKKGVHCPFLLYWRYDRVVKIALFLLLAILCAVLAGVHLYRKHLASAAMRNEIERRSALCKKAEDAIFRYSVSRNFLNQHDAEVATDEARGGDVGPIRSNILYKYWLDVDLCNRGYAANRPFRPLERRACDSQSGDMIAVVRACVGGSLDYHP